MTLVLFIYVMIMKIPCRTSSALTLYVISVLLPACLKKQESVMNIGIYNIQLKIFTVLIFISTLKCGGCKNNIETRLKEAMSFGGLGELRGWGIQAGFKTTPTYTSNECLLFKIDCDKFRT